MGYLRKNWFDFGGGLAALVLAYMAFNHIHLSDYQFLMWVSLITLFLHQLEEYRVVGTFPGMINTVLYKSDMPDRFPLNMNTSLVINVYIGWFSYYLAALFAEKVVWLGIATVLVSLGNTIGHTILFNLRGKTYYNAGLATCLFLFVPVIYFFLQIVVENHLATTTDWIVGIALGIAFNYIGILKIIDWMADKNSPYVFPERCMLKK